MFFVSNTALYAFQRNLLAAHHFTGAVPDNVPVCFQRHVAKLPFRILSAGQKLYRHVPRQSLSFHGTAHRRYVNISALFRLRVKYHIV